MAISEQKLDFWIKNNLNVLIEGKHGTGKTTMFIEAFERNKLRWKYFSAPTLDPWVDLIGVPKETTDDNGDTYLKLIRPQELAKDQVECIFFDELNRAKPKVLNAVMELIQFKSINGHKFNNLKFIWASINPKDVDDEDFKYMVEQLDPAQEDRFHIQVRADDKPNKPFFTKKFGKDVSDAAIGWWNGLEKLKKNVSPRRLEMAVDHYLINGDLNDVLPDGCNVAALILQLEDGSFYSILNKLMHDNNEVDIKARFSSSNFYNGAIKVVLKDEKMINFFHQYFSPEQFNNLLLSNESFRTKILNNQEFIKTHFNKIKDILEAGAGKVEVLRKIKEATDSYSKSNNLLTPVEIFINEYYIELTKDFNNADDRTEVAEKLENLHIGVSNSQTELVRLGVINSIIGGKTYINSFESTKTVFSRIDHILTEWGMSFDTVFANNIQTDALYRKTLNATEELRVKNRLIKMGLIT